MTNGTTTDPREKSRNAMIPMRIDDAVRSALFLHIVTITKAFPNVVRKARRTNIDVKTYFAASVLTSQRPAPNHNLLLKVELDILAHFLLP